MTSFLCPQCIVHEGVRHSSERTDAYLYTKNVHYFHNYVNLRYGYHMEIKELSHVQLLPWAYARKFSSAPTIVKTKGSSTYVRDLKYKTGWKSYHIPTAIAQLFVYYDDWRQ